MSVRSAVNRRSFFVTSLVAVAGGWLVASPFGGVASAVAALGVGAGLVVAQRYLRRGGSGVASWDEARAQFGRGTPTVVFLYSDT